MSKSSKNICLYSESRGRCDAVIKGIPNGLARSARNYSRRRRNPYRYQKGVYVSIRNERAVFTANLGGTAEVKHFCPCFWGRSFFIYIAEVLFL